MAPPDYKHMQKHMHTMRIYYMLYIFSNIYYLLVYGSSVGDSLTNTDENYLQDMYLGYSNDALSRSIVHNVEAYDPSIAILVHIFNDNTNPSQIPNILASNSNGFWKALLKSHENHSFDDFIWLQVDHLAYVDNLKPRLSHISPQRIRVTGYCVYAPDTPKGRCNGSIYTDFDKAYIDQMQTLLQSHEALVSLRIEGLGDLRKMSIIHIKELAAQRIARLVAANPRYLLSPQSSGVASVRMIKPLPSPYNIEDNKLNQGSLDNIKGFAVKHSAIDESDHFSQGSQSGSLSTSHQFGSWKDITLENLRTASYTIDKSIELLISIPEASFLNTEVVQQIFSLINGPEISQPKKGDIGVAKPAKENKDLLKPKQKYFDIDRINFKGTCRVVVTCTGDTALLKTKIFGQGLSIRQLRAQERILLPKRLLLHVEIQGLGKNTEDNDTGKVFPLSYYVKPELYNTLRYYEPYTASEAAARLCIGLKDPSSHPWGDAKVVFWESHPSYVDNTTKSTSSSTFHSGISDYEIWKLIAVILVPAVFIGILLILSWKCTSTKSTENHDTQAYKFHTYLPETSCSRIVDTLQPPHSPTRSDITLDINMDNMSITPSLRKCTSM